MKIKTLEKVEKAIFQASLEDKLDIKELGKMYAWLIQMQCEMLDILPEEDVTVEGVGEMWFRVTESILNLKIMIREQKGLDVSEEVEKMKRLWERAGISY